MHGGTRTRWMAVMAPAGPSAMPARAAARRSPANSARMNTAQHRAAQPWVKGQLIAQR